MMVFESQILLHLYHFSHRRSVSCLNFQQINTARKSVDMAFPTNALNTLN